MPYDPLNFANKPDYLSDIPKDEYALQLAEEELKADQAQLGELNKAQQNVDQQNKQQEADQQQQDAKAQAMESESSALNIGENIKNNISNAFEVPTALVGGFIDFAEDIGNRTGAKWLDLDDRIEPQNRTEYGKALRSIVSVVGPNLVGLLTLKRGVNGFAKNWPGISQLTKLNAPTKAGLDIAASAGIGVAVDAVSRESDDRNLTGTLKEEFPSVFGWIPDNIATLDTDSPDVKRKKNILEGFGLGGILDGVGYLAKAAKPMVKGLLPGTKIVPLDDTAKASIAREAEQVKPLTGNPAVDYVGRNVEAREAHEAASVMDEFQRNPDPQNPTPRMNPDLFNKHETGISGIRPNAVRRGMVDAGRIHTNTDTVNGVIENIVSEPALREGLDAASQGKRPVIEMVAKGIRESGKFKAVTQLGKEIDPRTMDEGMLSMYKQIIDPNNKLDDISDVFIDEKFINNNFKVDGKGIEQITDRAYTTSMLAVRRLMDDYMSAENAKAAALTINSVAGEVTDLAHGVKIFGNEIDTSEVQQRILDKVEFLLNETWVNSYASGMALRNKGFWAKAKNVADLGRIAKEAHADITDKFAKKAAQNKEFVDNLRTISRENPEYLKPLMEAYDLTNGDVRTISALNGWFNKHLNPAGLITKGFIDNDPSMPNFVQQGLWSTIYNSILSASSTFTNAWFGNAALIVSKPFTQLLGTGLDHKQLQRWWVQYGAFGDSFQNAMSYARLQTQKIMDDPVKYGNIDRPDFAIMDEDRWMVLENIASARAAKGESGPMHMYRLAKALRDFNNSKWVRYSANLMSSGDAFTRAFLGSAQARARAYTDLLDQGGDITEASLKQTSDRIYKEMFDQDGIIRDEVVDFQTKEIAMSLDNPVSNAVTGLTTAMPILKPFILFPRTTTNMLGMGFRYSPLGVLHKDFLMAVRPTQATKEQIAEFMAARGITNYSYNDWLDAAAETRGRVATGAIALFGANQLLLQGALTGSPPADKEQRRSMEKAMGGAYWNSVKIGNQWYSHQWMGPMSSVLTMAADTANLFWANPNEGILENIHGKILYSVGLNITNKSWTQGLASFFDLTSGNKAALNRWIANTGNSIIPFAGARGQVSRIYDPALREVEDDIGQLMRNRNSLLDIFDPNGKLPYSRDIMDGSILNNHNLLVRLLNASTPIKVNTDKMTPGRQLLIDAGYNAVPSLTKYHGSPEKYTHEQRSKLAGYMGIYGNIESQLEELTKKPWVQQELAAIKDARMKNIESKELDFGKGNLHREIDRIFLQAKQFAESKLLNENPQMRAPGFAKGSREMQLRTGQDIQKVINFHRQGS
jgi:hypothetical protein